MTTLRTRLGQSVLLWMGPGAFVLAILLINPVRETALGDDWIYSLTVRHLLDTGTYKLHDGSDSNMLFQAYWGRFFAGILGYSFTSLRVSTLVLTFFGLIAFYYLAREHRLNHIQACLIMLGLFSSPFVMLYGFSFNTDVPFLMCVIIAMFLYTRGIRLASYSLMLLASVSASAAILTRQFGLALPACFLYGP